MIKNKSFTLIELLVVIVIIGILAGVIIVSTSSSISKANIAKVKVFENSIQNELGANMVSRWKLDEIVGTTTTPDAWGNNTGTLGDGVTASTYPTLKEESECVTGKCMSFDGINNYIDCGDNNNLNITEQITISAWINYKDQTLNDYLAIVSRRINDVGGYSIRITKNSKLLYFQTSNLGSSTTYHWQNPISFNSFQHIAVTFNYNSGEVVTYLNGALDKKMVVLSELESVSKNFYIGSYLGSYFFNGLIDDVRVYDAALSSAQIKQQYIAGLNSLLANGNISKEEYEQGLNNLAYEK